jgi:hypothetical protein
MVETFRAFPVPPAGPHHPLAPVDRPSFRAALPRLVGILGALATFLHGAAHADVFKCAGEGGRPIYQESPCPTGKELRNFQTDPPEITVLPGSKLEVPAPSAPGTKGAKEAKGDKASTKTAKVRGDPGERKFLRNGMSEAQVLARLGPPDATTGSKSTKQQRWSWFPADGDPETVTTVTLASGVVTNVERTVVKK